MKIVFMGTMPFATPILEGLIQQNYEVSLVVTQPDRPFGRKQVLKPSPVKEMAMKYDIPVFQPEKIRNDYQTILDHQPELIVVCAYGQMIPTEVLEYPKYKSINVHASLLPKFRGGAPMHKAIQRGEKITGVSIMFMHPKMDSGPVLKQSKLEILDTDDVGSLQDKLAILGRDALLEVIPLVEKGLIEAIPQDESQITFAYNIKPEEEHLDFNQSARMVFNHVRGYHPWPLTYAWIDDLMLKMYQVEPISFNTDKEHQPGEIVHVDKKSVIVACLEGFISLKKIQLQGKNVMDIQSFLNGNGKELLKTGKILK